MLISTSALIASGPRHKPGESAAYLGFDRNQYPGDRKLQVLRRTFSYSGYWLNAPPGEKTTSWTGKRNRLLEAGFGFLVLFRGKTDAQIKAGGDPKELGKSDAEAAVTATRKEGFRPGTIIFLDQEEGGRLLPRQKDYLFAWMDAVDAAGFRAGVYCSGVPFQEGSGNRVVTAEDIRNDAAGRQISYWVSNDACPPSPGCAFPRRVPSPGESGVKFASVWQFAQSPRRASVAGGCPANYSGDGNCYPPRSDPRSNMFVDLNSSSSSDPSAGR
jgi:hypothetical protein